jgi:hypothetical protein
VVGFFPSVFANCAFVFLVMKVVLDRMYQAHKRSDKLLRGESTGDAKEAGGGDSFEAANPLTATAGGGSKGSSPPLGRAGRHPRLRRVTAHPWRSSTGRRRTPITFFNTRTFPRRRTRCGRQLQGRGAQRQRCCAQWLPCKRMIFQRAGGLAFQSMRGGSNSLAQRGSLAPTPGMTLCTSSQPGSSTGGGAGKYKSKFYFYLGCSSLRLNNFFLLACHAY